MLPAGRRRDGVQQPHPGGVGQGGEPLGVRGGGVVVERRGATPPRLEGQVGGHDADLTSIMHRWLHSSRSIDTVPSTSSILRPEPRMTVTSARQPSSRGRRRRPDRPRRRRPRAVPAAADARPRGRDPAVAASVREWGHVRLFSSWSELVDPAAATLLGRRGWDRARPDDLPHRPRLGRPLPRPAGRGAGRPPTRSRSGSGTAWSASPSEGRDRLVDSGRDDAPFTVLVETARRDRADRGLGRHRRLRHLARAQPARRRRPARPRGGRARRPDHLRHPGLRPTREVRARYAGKRVAVAGRGASAQNTLVGLAGARRARTPGTTVAWLRTPCRHRRRVRRWRQRPARGPRCPRQARRRPSSSPDRSRSSRRSAPPRSPTTPTGAWC